jgi:hypothetical protein
MNSIKSTSVALRRISIIDGERITLFDGEALGSRFISSVWGSAPGPEVSQA